MLCCLEGNTQDEAAQKLAWPLSTLKLRLSQGRELLRRRLARRGLTLGAVLSAAVLSEGAASAALPAASEVCSALKNVVLIRLLLSG